MANVRLDAKYSAREQRLGSVLAGLLWCISAVTLVVLLLWSAGDSASQI